MKEVYFLAKDPTEDRFLIHKIVINEDETLEIVGYCATMPDDPESDYKAVSRYVDAYQSSFDTHSEQENFYEGFSLWLIDYFKKHYLPIGQNLEEIVIQSNKSSRRYIWKRDGELIKRVEI